MNNKKTSSISASLNNDNVTFQQNGSPFSQQFDDIYFDTQFGYGQSEDVFIKGNDIAERLITNEQALVIGETGFGTGLNFFLTLNHFIKAKAIHQQSIKPLTYISVEKYPLSGEQIEQSLSLWPEFSPIVAEFIAQYSQRNIEASTLELSFFDGLVQLVLIFDDATQGFEQLTSNVKQAKHQNKRLISPINAWYLDGFSPAKNPEMWNDDLFKQLARLSKDDATLATFTVAGLVKRGLINVGFRLSQTEAIGRKNKSISAKYQQNKNAGKGYVLRPHHVKPTRVAVIGSGIAAASLVYKLTKENIRVNLYCQDERLAQGGSSNAIGAVYPLLHQDRDDISDFYHQAFVCALGFYQSLTDKGINYPHQWCGVLDLAFKPALVERLKRFDDINAWPKDIIHSIDAKQASEIAGIPIEHDGLYMPRAGWVAPQKLVKAIFQAADETGFLKVKTSCQITKLTQVANGHWRLHHNNKIDNAEQVIMCGGAQSNLIAPFDELPLYPVRGQISSMHTNNDISKLSTVICHKGYLTPENDGIHCIGATFDKDERNIEVREQDDLYNLAMYQRSLPNFPKWTTNDIKASKARLRCMTPDHMPIAGPMPKTDEYYQHYQHLEKDKNWSINTPAPYYENLFVMSGLGARGLCSAPLLADIIVADICGTPYPVDSKTRFNLAPNRFAIKDIIKGKFK